MDSAITHPATHPAIDELTAISTFSDLPADGLEWLASHMEAFDLEPGAVLVHAGEPAEHLAVLFRGEVRAERANGGVYVMHPGQVTGLLPYSRLTQYPSTGRAVMESRGARLHKSYFPEMLQRMPVLNQRLVSVLADRIRQTAVADQQREKLMALGKLSAGLAHELNNPAGAVRRAADALRQAILSVRRATLQLDQRGLPQPARLFIARLDCDWLRQAGEHSALDTLERSEREEEFATWLEDHQIPNAWELAAALVDAGCERSTLEEVVKQIPPEFLADAFTRLTASFTISRLIEEIDSGVGKISELVRAVKEYSYMDQMPEQEIDVHNGLENTLIMLRHRLKYGIEVVRDYDRTLPMICARGSELNQVWTNLISNAIDAMNGNGKLHIRTAREAGCAVVEITDNGPGIPSELQPRIFEPFFTTKPVGEGTGLGLDTVYRIVTNHHGHISFESHPGETRFTVRIPFSKEMNTPSPNVAGD
ncbi:MAG: cyclic nucleotide-binding domain-containing protein [Acidobacteriaceae bacterium]|nr:cyclic nucleotide-binding domain-containing protein [Acidobacteriaceae bacterium]MBV9502780.1 cyclic nucleotide-binding domain-containing protein [Acidobacteriaceae bacterium]